MPWAPTDEGSDYVAGFFSNLGTYQTSGGSAATANDDPVGEWVNQVDSATNLEGGAGSARPLLKTSGGPPGLSGYYLAFDGSNDILSYLAPLMGTDPAAWTMGVICTASSSAAYITAGVTDKAMISKFSGTDFEYYGSSPRFTILSSPAAGFHALSFGGDGGGMTSRYDGNAGGSSGTAAPGGQQSHVGGSGPSDFFNGGFAALLAFKRYDTTLVSNVDTYLTSLLTSGSSSMPLVVHHRKMQGAQ